MNSQNLHLIYYFMCIYLAPGSTQHGKHLQLFAPRGHQQLYPKNDGSWWYNDTAIGMIRWHSPVFQKDLLLENQFWRNLTFLFDLEVFLKLRIYFQSSNSKDLIFRFDLFKTCLRLETWSWVVIDPVFLKLNPVDQTKMSTGPFQLNLQRYNNLQLCPFT